MADNEESISEKDRTIYSVKIRRGLDIEHYDLVFTDRALRLRYLGEYWDRSRPITGLQQRADLYIYKLRKRRARETEEHSIEIPYRSIRKVQLHPPKVKRRWLRIAGRKTLEETHIPPRLVIETVGGDTYVIEFSAKVYELVKSLTKKYLATKLQKRQAK